MTFNPNARLDTSQVEDVRGRGGGIGPGMMVGGGGLGLVITIIALLLGVNPSDPGTVPAPYETLPNQEVGQPGAAPSTIEQTCQTGADANQREDCRIVGFVNSIQAYWTDEFAARGGQYVPAKTRFFSGATQSDCGYASSEMGPFYCPIDQRVFIDLGFFDELQGRFGASGGPFAQAYVLAHEYGHHVQNVLGYEDTFRAAQKKDPEKKNELSVRFELQADCLAGVWAHASQKKNLLEPGDVEEGLKAAAAIGDDTLQKQSGGTVSPESWTHGSSEQRQKWLRRGLDQGTIAACDTTRGSP